MRKLFTIFSLVCIALLASCTKGSYTDLVPKDATIVAAVRLDKLVQDADVPNSSLMSYADDYMGVIANGEDREMLREFMDDPSVIGLDFSEPAYVFATHAKHLGLVLKVDDADRVDAFFEFMHKLQLATKTTSRGHLTWTDLLGDFHVAYDQRALLVLMDAEGKTPANMLRNHMTALFDQDAEDSFGQHPCSEEWAKSPSHIQFYARATALPSDWGEGVKSLLPQGVRVADVAVKADVQFSSGEAIVNARLTSENESVEEKLGAQTKHTKPIQGAFLNMVPDDFLAFATLGCEGEWLLDLLKSNADTKQRLFLMERAIDIEAILRAVEGDVAVVLPTTYIDHSNDLTAAAQIKSTDFMSDFNYWKQTAKDYHITLSKIADDQYCVSAEGQEILWGIDKSEKPATIYFATSAALRQQAFGRRSSSLAGYHDLMSQSDFFACVNIKPLKEHLASHTQVPAFLTPMLQASELLLLSKSQDGQFTLRLIAKDPSTNILKQLF